jgi:hypothetical protein
MPDAVSGVHPVHDGATDHGRHRCTARGAAQTARGRLMSWSRPWDTRVVFIERRQRWWWNAWQASTSTELHGFADSQEEAARDMYRAIEQASGNGPSSVIES